MTAKQLNTEERRVTSSISDRGLASSHKSGGVASSAYTKRTKDTTCIGDTIEKLTKIKKETVTTSTKSAHNTIQCDKGSKIVQYKLQTLKKPKVCTTTSHIRFERYKEYFNNQHLDSDGKNILSEQLRVPHELMFKKLVNEVRKQAKEYTSKYSQDYTFEVGRYYEIRTNRSHLSALTGGMSVDTVRRVLDRLAESGVIKTLFRGREHNFSVYVDTQFLPFFETKINTDNQQVMAKQQAICIPYILEHENKVIIDVDNSSSSIEQGHAQEQHKNTNTKESGNSNRINQTSTSTSTAQEHTRTLQEPLQEQGVKYNQTAEIIKEKMNIPLYEISGLSKMEQAALDAAHTTFALIMQTLYVGREIATVEQIRAIRLIYLQSFRFEMSYQAIDRLSSKWKWKIQRVADHMTYRRYSRKGKWEPPTPVYYFDEQNNDKNSSFYWAERKWNEMIEKNRKKRVHNDLKKKKRDDDYVLQQCLISVAIAKTQAMIMTQHDFLRNNYAHLVKRFERTIIDPQFSAVLRAKYDLKQAKVSVKRLTINS